MKLETGKTSGSSTSISPSAPRDSEFDLRPSHPPSTDHRPPTTDHPPPLVPRPSPVSSFQFPVSSPPLGTQHSALVLPLSYNYIAAFLTFRCPYRCSYCINRQRHSRLTHDEIGGADWLRFFDRLDAPNVPITLQGGEPGIHPDFLMIVKETLARHPVDILTNLTFDLRRFADAIDPAAINREAPYAPIRASYHPEQFSLQEVLGRVLFLQQAGFRVGLYGVTHPAQETAIAHARTVCEDLGIDFRTKPFLGWHDGRLHGDYAYPDACSLETPRPCECASSELLVAPDGHIHRCHHHLYGSLAPSAHIGDPDLTLSDDFHPCRHYGHCNPCDVKIKNNRFQQFGHVSVRIRCA